MRPADHFPIRAHLQGPVVPDFYQIEWVCNCGQDHFWLVTQEEVAVAVAVLGQLREARKARDAEILQEEPDWISAQALDAMGEKGETPDGSGDSPGYHD